VPALAAGDTALLKAVFTTLLVDEAEVAAVNVERAMSVEPVG
jgi:hypothetical protein